MTINELKEQFIARYGGDLTGIRIFSAPGRVNLIGEHTDYNGGFVFPAALTLRSAVAVRKRNDGIINMGATTISSQVRAEVSRIGEYRKIGWGSYQLGVADELIKKGLEITGGDLFFDIDIPIASGLSSSAAIEISSAFAFICECSSNGTDPESIDRLEIARLCQKAENEYVGVNCGILDQFASIMGKKDNAIFLNCGTMEYRYVPLKIDGYKLVIANTNVKRSLAVTKYNERRSECEQGFEILLKSLPEKKNLGEVTLQEFELFKDTIPNETIRKRVKHVVTEDNRVKASVLALESGDLATFGKLMVESHRSLQSDYEVTGEELDSLVDEALKISGVIGSRMTGAGFGGCTVNIVSSTRVDEFIEKVGKKYYERMGGNADFYVSDIGDGARELKEEE
jgi:galactokinase